jgi:hypothetical protein
MLRLDGSHKQTESLREDGEKKIRLLEDTIREKEKLIKNYTPLTSFDSSFITYDNKRNFVKSQEFDHISSLNASLLFRDNNNNNNNHSNTDLKQSINNQWIAEEQRKVKEKLQNTISQKADAFEKSKIQRKENFDNLKSRLHDIEIMSSNVSFHGTSS